MTASRSGLGLGLGDHFEVIRVTLTLRGDHFEVVGAATERIHSAAGASTLALALALAPALSSTLSLRLDLTLPPTPTPTPTPTPSPTSTPTRPHDARREGCREAGDLGQRRTQPLEPFARLPHPAPREAHHGGGRLTLALTIAITLALARTLARTLTLTLTLTLPLPLSPNPTPKQAR